MDAATPAIRTEDSNLVAMPDITNERSMWSLMQSQANVLVKSGMLPSSVKTAESAIAIMQTGREFGLQPMQSFRMIHIIEGKPTLSAQFMAALVNRHCAKAGGYLRQAELTDQRCVIEYKRPEWPAPQTFSFSMEDAKRAGLSGKGNWVKHPREMMYNRAVSNACRMGWPELVAGVYDPDELEAPSYSVQQAGIQQDFYAGETGLTQPGVVRNAPPASDPRERANARHFALISQKGLTDDERRALQRIAYGVQSARELSRDQLIELGNTIEAKSAAELREAIELQLQMDAEDAAAADSPDMVDDDESASEVHPRIQDAIEQRDANWIAAMEGAASMPELQRIGVQIAQANVPKESRLRSVYTKQRERIEGSSKATSARPVNDIVDQAPLMTGEPGDDRHTS